MITISEFSKMLSSENEIIHAQTKDLSHADTLIQPQPGGNCLNWVLGHLLDGLINILKVVGGEVPSDLPDLTRYRRESSPIFKDEPGVLSLKQLLENLNLITNNLVKCLQDMTESEFDQEVDLWGSQVRRGWVAFFYYFHYTYHLGQLEYLRNLAGKTDKII